MITTLRLITGFAAAVCFAYVDRLMVPGAMLCFLSGLMDRADGELARQSGQFSRFGSRFDLVADCTATMCMFIGLGLGFGPSLPLMPVAGVGLGISGAVSVASIFLLLNGTGVPPRRTRRRPARSRMFDPDDIMLVVPVAVLCGGGPWIVLASGMVTPVAAILLSLRALGRRRPASAPPDPDRAR